MRFYIGLHQPSDARHFRRAFVSVNRLRGRLTLRCSDWIMDSGAFSELSRFGRYREPVSDYAREAMRWVRPGSGLTAVVSQDYMCEPHILARTGLTVRQHQRRTTDRYDQLLRLVSGVYVMPVLQGYEPAEYARHVRQYGDRLGRRAYVGVGSVCRRNESPDEVLAVLRAIKQERPDLRLHGFGLKMTALSDRRIRGLLASADSMAWVYHAWRHGRDRNSHEEAQRWLSRLNRRMGARE